MKNNNVKNNNVNVKNNVMSTNINAGNKTKMIAPSLPPLQNHSGFCPKFAKLPISKQMQANINTIDTDVSGSSYGNNVVEVLINFFTLVERIMSYVNSSSGNQEKNTSLNSVLIASLTKASMDYSDMKLSELIDTLIVQMKDALNKVEDTIDSARWTNFALMLVGTVVLAALAVLTAVTGGVGMALLMAATAIIMVVASVAIESQLKGLVNEIKGIQQKIDAIKTEKTNGTITNQTALSDLNQEGHEVNGDVSSTSDALQKISKVVEILSIITGGLTLLTLPATAVALVELESLTAMISGIIAVVIDALATVSGLISTVLSLCGNNKLAQDFNYINVNYDLGLGVAKAAESVGIMGKSSEDIVIGIVQAVSQLVMGVAMMKLQSKNIGTNKVASKLQVDIGKLMHIINQISMVLQIGPQGILGENLQATSTLITIGTDALATYAQKAQTSQQANAAESNTQADFYSTNLGNALKQNGVDAKNINDLNRKFMEIVQRELQNMYNAASAV